MKDFERDYLDDPTATPGFEHGDEIPSSTAPNPTFYDIVEQARASRRSFLFGGLAAAVTSGMASVGLSPRAAQAQSAAATSLLGFAPVPVSKEDTVVVPAGYKVQVLAPGARPFWTARRPTRPARSPARRSRCRWAATTTGCTSSGSTAARPTACWW